MRPPSDRPTPWGLRGALAILLLMVVLGLVAVVRAVFRSFDYTCEVCVTHDGRTACREAVGSAPGEARTIALERACAFLATDRADRTACVESSPVRVDCREN